MKHTILITEQQANNLQDKLNDPLFNNVGHTFSIDTLKKKKKKNGSEIIQYCENCNLYKLGEGGSRVVYQIDDEKVIKIEKDKQFATYSQNNQEVISYRKCDNKMKEFVPKIYEWDKNHIQPLWIISEQVLTATYADFPKLLGFDFGSYTSSADITQMKQDMQTYSKYPGKTINRFSLNLMDFLESYGDNDLSLYQSEIANNKWLQNLKKMLDNGVVNYWELEIIENWGIVHRNGKTQLVILDIGI